MVDFVYPLGLEPQYPVTVMGNEILNWVVLTFFLIATGALAVYGLHLYVLVLLFRRRVRDVRAAQKESVDEFRRMVPDNDWPAVTTQIPLYNEKDVSGRVIRLSAGNRNVRGL